MSDIQLQASRLHAQYGQKTVLHQVDLDLRAGQIVGLIGPNGAGKSSLIRVLAGLHPTSAGSVTVQGVDIQKSPEKARHLIGMVPQDVALFDELSAEETLLLVGRLRNLEGTVLQQEVRRWLALSDLTNVGQSMAKYYSGGMRRKLALGAALIGAPPVLLLDESFAGLDPEGTHAMERELLRHARAGSAILLCSHRLELLERIADRVVLLQDGSVSHTMTRSGIERLKEDRNSSLLDWYLETVNAPSSAVPEDEDDETLMLEHAPSETQNAADAARAQSSVEDGPARTLEMHDDTVTEVIDTQDTTVVIDAETSGENSP